MSLERIAVSVADCSKQLVQDKKMLDKNITCT